MKKKVNREEKEDFTKNIVKMLYREFGACFLLVESKGKYQLWERGERLEKGD